MSIRAKYKSTIKRVICYIVSFAMIVGMAPVTAQAEETSYTYSIECGEYCDVAVTQTVGETTTEVAKNTPIPCGTEDIVLKFKTNNYSFSGIIVKEGDVEKKCIRAEETEEAVEGVDGAMGIYKTCTYTISAEDFSKDISIKIVDWDYPFDNEYMIQYDGVSGADVTLEGNTVEGSELQSFEANKELAFVLTPPSFVTGAPYKVMLCKNMEEEVDVTNQLTADDDGNYIWKYTPSDTTGFVVSITWSKEEADIIECYDYIDAHNGAIAVCYDYDMGGSVAIKANDKIIKQAEYNKSGMLVFEESTTLELVITPDEGGAINSIYYYDDYYDDELDLTDASVFDAETGTLKVSVDVDSEIWPYVGVDFAIDGYQVSYVDSNVDVSCGGITLDPGAEYEFSDAESSVTLDIKKADSDAEFYGIIVRSENKATYCIKAEDMADTEVEGLYHFTIADTSDYYMIEVVGWYDESLVYDGQYKVDYSLMYDYNDDNRGYVLVNDDIIYSIRERYDHTEEISVDYTYTEGETIDFVIVPPVGMEGKPYMVATCGYEQDWVNADMTKVVAGEALEDGRIPYTFSYTPTAGFTLGIWWEQAQYEFDMCQADWEKNQIEATYYVQGKNPLTIQDNDETNNVIAHKQYKEEGKVILDDATDLKVTVPEGYRDKVVSLEINNEIVNLEDTSVYNPETGEFIWNINPENVKHFYIEFNLPGIQNDSDAMNMTITMDGDEVPAWEGVGFPSDATEVKLGFKPNPEYTIQGIKISGDDYPDYVVGFDEMEYNEETGEYELTITKLDRKYIISDVSEGDNEYTFRGEYVVYYSAEDGAQVSLGKAENIIGAYEKLTYDTETVSSFDFILQNPEGQEEAPYKVLYQINGYDQVEVAAEDIVAVEGEEGVYSYTLDMGKDAGAGFKLWVYWTEAEYNYEQAVPKGNQAQLRYYVNNGSMPSVTVTDGNSTIVKQVSYSNQGKVIIEPGYNDVDMTYLPITVEMVLENSSQISGIDIDGWAIALDGTDESYNPTTGKITLTMNNGEWKDVGIDYKQTGYNVGFNSDMYGVTVDGNALSADNDYSFGEAENVKLVFSPLAPEGSEAVATIYGIRVYKGQDNYGTEEDEREITYIKASALTDEGNGSYSYTISDTNDYYRIEIVDGDGQLFDGEYKLCYDNSKNTVTIGGEKVEAYKACTYTVDENGDATFTFNITPSEDNNDAPFGIIVDINDAGRYRYYYTDENSLFTDNGGSYTFTYTMEETYTGRGVTFTVCSDSDEFNFEDCLPYSYGEYQFNYDANADIAGVISLDYSDKSESAWANVAAYKSCGRAVFNTDQTVTFTITP